MGNHHLKPILSLKKKKNKTPNYINEIPCPICNKKFKEDINPDLFNNHVKECISKDIPKSCDLYSPSQDIIFNKQIFENIIEYNKYNPNNYIDMRIEDKINEIKMCIIEKKLENENTIRIVLNRDYLLKDSIQKLFNVNFYQDWKINFFGELSIDSGGIIREFFTNIFQILEGNDLKLFIKSENSEISYTLNPFLLPNKENLTYCKLIGLLMAKAIAQNITINICFNKLMYKMILIEKINFEDLIFIDSQLYKSLKNLKENLELNNDNENNFNLLNDLDINYIIEMKDCFNQIHSLELIENGKNITVTNLDDFIQKRIDLLIGIYEPFIKQIRDNFYKYIPKDKIKILNSNELELILNGRPFIDVEEWKSYTEYKGIYNENHYVIKWFWEILSELSQKELSNLLLFSTGSSRVPLGGFADLESNGGFLSKFTIEYIEYNKNIKNFIKAHTCFNRIDLPCYINKKELECAIKFVAENQILGFGME